MKKIAKMRPVREKGLFKNYPGEKKHPLESLFSFFWRACKTYLSTQPYTKLNLPYNFTEELTKSLKDALQNKRNTLWWLGHATFLFYINGSFIITDPVLQTPSPIFPRLFSSGDLAVTLPPIDTVLISHNHYDHLDKTSIQALLEKNPNLAIYVPEGDGALCKKWLCKNVYEATWWDTFSGPNEQTITFVPAKHWSRRTLFDCNRSLWGGWVIETKDSTIYFAGDTAYGDHFKSIQDSFPSITHALIPIGPCEPQKENEDSHLNPNQAGQAFTDLQAACMVPCHWGTFPLGTDQPLAPIDRLQYWIRNQSNTSIGICRILFPGEALEISSTIIRDSLPIQKASATIHTN